MDESHGFCSLLFDIFRRSSPKKQAATLNDNNFSHILPVVVHAFSFWRRETSISLAINRSTHYFTYTKHSTSMMISSSASSTSTGSSQ
ncbi:unnamed protein product [Arctia plantaginis]|uniref:Uncharacterized protein n=1 Tax=Arctia plantaginis TaxID=874455 RepID=A0A8S0Z5I2_ARCPL|nr:unnamed protein product [Arctia plantaginis]